MSHLPAAHRHDAGCGCYTTDLTTYQASPLAPAQAAQPQVVHIHQAAPDRTVQRLALGAGMGAGTVSAAVYFGPLLVGALTAIAVDLAVVAVVIVAAAWAVVVMVRAVGGPDGKSAAKTLRSTRRR
ncbi:DUF6251 family protein [Streptomyces sp. RKAG337]|uniref:DUF6251 family protein n=1 Tax=Streptomyces sp. RKAG337 TaxID=2893404 RepID=UPI00203426DF|nr:DUF6251 family protein [Streptomyces sp. RKAG337]MCM2427554.1 DUF6251 family protein [Streptomyces sp. RKAG337]